VNRLLNCAIVATTAALLISGCGKSEESKPTPPPNPTQIAGKPITEDPSGLRPNAPGPTRPIDNSIGGDIDQLAALSIADIEQFWPGAYAKPLTGKFTPVNALFSWDSRFKKGKFCRKDIKGFYNAQWCNRKQDANCPTDGSPCLPSYNTIGWDRGAFLPDVRALAGDMGITLILSHEYGHAISWGMADLFHGQSLDSVEVALASEQQADCFAGVYMRWVVDGKSPRFTLNTGDGLTKVLAAMVSLRDPLVSEDYPGLGGLYHGSAFERLTAFQFGFDEGAAKCTTIDAKEVAARRNKIPKDLLAPGETGEVPISKESVGFNVEALAKSFPLAEPPKVSFDPAACPDAAPTPAVTFCPSTNTLAVDMSRLIMMGTSLGRGSAFPKRSGVLFGDYTSYSVLVSRYMLAVQKAKGGLSLDNTNAGLRTACLTGVATTKMSTEMTLANGAKFRVTGGDLDEAVAGLLTNGLAASNIKAVSAPSAFARVDAFRTGVLGDENACYKAWP
jgi:predicted metalloprotease